MANNRLFVRCTICHAEVPIARLSAGDDHWTPARGEAIPAWPAFLIAHQDCDPEGRLHVELSSETDERLVLGGER